MWFRIFGTRDTIPAPAALLEHLQTQGMRVEGHFKGDDLGWFDVDFVLPGAAQPLHLDRYLTEADDLRDQLNAWAAWLEAQEGSETAHRLMQHMIAVQQLFTLSCPRDRSEEEATAGFCQELCRYLAKQTDGVYQIDNQGFFAPDGKLLIKETV
ncbi:hypothetical protein AYO44_02460 [Planctomycetaceae bacterium SCGC AG-212-F19]|nr:hypothetical protein AYO44_02460 [Planctomycetaceae bacterium SCGC AG-212-F19]